MQYSVLQEIAKYRRWREIWCQKGGFESFPLTGDREELLVKLVINSLSTLMFISGNQHGANAASIIGVDKKECSTIGSFSLNASSNGSRLPIVPFYCETLEYFQRGINLYKPDSFVRNHHHRSNHDVGEYL